MAKFELPIRDAITGEIVKTHQRNFMPVSLYIKFQKTAEEFAEKGMENMSDEEMLDAMENLFVELFPEMTREEYRDQSDVAQVLKVWGDVLKKSTDLADGDSKNG